MDPFATLGIAPRFDVDLAALEKTHRELSRALHPDKYVSAGASERKDALNRAVEVNEAWRTVRDPVKRAEALFARAGIVTGETNEPNADPEFLMEMMEQREALADAKASKDAAAVHALAGAMRARMSDASGALAKGFANGATKDALTPLVGKLGELRFYRRFLEEVSAIEDAFEEAGDAGEASDTKGNP